MFQFTFKNLEKYFASAQLENYRVVTCKEYAELKSSFTQIPKILVNRVDVDCSIKKARRVADIFNALKIKATFFIRLHANEYNPFSFEAYNILKYIRDTGHEIGYHSEIIDTSVIWGEYAEDCLRRDVEIFNRMLDIKISGVASHCGMTGLNNLDFWKDKKPSDFGLLYEAYDTEPAFNLFHQSFYISDSQWTRWKCYQHGKLCENDHRNLSEHLQDQHPLIYTLIHPETYFDKHFYE